MEGPSGEATLPKAGRAGPRQPLHPLPSRPSLGDRLPPRPSELLKVSYLGQAPTDVQGCSPTLHRRFSQFK